MPSHLSSAFSWFHSIGFPQYATQVKFNLFIIYLLFFLGNLPINDVSQATSKVTMGC